MVTIDSSVIARVASFAGEKVVDIVRLADGATNDTYKVTIRARREPVVLRLYRHPANLQVEVSALRKVCGKVPAPTLLHVECGAGNTPPFIILEYVDGITFRRFRRTHPAVVGEMAYRIGRVLAAVHVAPLGILDQTEQHGSQAEAAGIAASSLLRQRVGAGLLRQAQTYVSVREGELRALKVLPCFTHGDFNNRNVLVRSSAGRWEVAAVVDWECAGRGTPLHDVARFLQYETRSNPSREPSFSRGYLGGGGHLPNEWWSLSRAINLINQCQLLSQQAVPDEIVREVIGLMHTTIAQSASAAGA